MGLLPLVGVVVSQRIKFSGGSSGFIMDLPEEQYSTSMMVIDPSL